MPESSTSVAQWRTRPVFISSTFRDMHAERDYLRTHVFPELEERLRPRRHALEPIDLRQGVETASIDELQAKELEVLKVCLSEIDRSRPFLIVLLGDRYGWVPPEERLAAAAQEAGFATDLGGKSVTALEIEFGILKKDPEQRRRSFFYFREPLPYCPTSRCRPRVLWVRGNMPLRLWQCSVDICGNRIYSWAKMRHKGSKYS